MNMPAPEVLLYALLLGVGMGAVFTLLDVLRIVLAPGKAVTFLLDVFFCLIATAASFLLALAVSGGVLRLYQAACELLGFSAVYLTVTYAVRCVLRRITQVCARQSEKLRRYMKRVGRKILRKKPVQAMKTKKQRRFFGVCREKIEKNT